MKVSKITSRRFIAEFLNTERGKEIGESLRNGSNKDVTPVDKLWEEYRNHIQAQIEQAELSSHNKKWRRTLFIV